MADYAKEPWMNPINNVVVDAMDGSAVQPVMMIDPSTGLPTGGGGGGGAGDASAANQATQIGLAEKDVWDKTAGNSIEFTYYTTVIGNNPSGNKNVGTSIYKTGVSTIFTQTFAYDVDDDIVSITTA